MEIPEGNGGFYSKIIGKSSGNIGTCWLELKVLMGKSTVNGGFCIAMFDWQRV